MSGLFTPLIGRTGNQIFQYCFARALAEREGKELVTPDWDGQKIFQIERTRPKRDDDIVLGGYCQNQESLIYTRAQAKEWLKFRPELDFDTGDKMLAHLRRGDYFGYGYPVVSVKSYLAAIRSAGYEPDDFDFVSEESPAQTAWLLPDLPFFPDFYRMTKATVLFRANSSFSFWAGVLSDAEIYSPVIDDLEGGKEHDCKFVPGNWPRLSNLPNITDLHLSE